MSPYKIKDITAIENMQRRATKLVPSLKNIEYEDRLRKLKLPTLKYRRLRGGMIVTYKLTSEIYDSTLPNILHYNTDTRMRGHNKKLSKQRRNKNIRANFFTQRIVTTWNQLPDSIVNAPTMHSFENRLDKYWNNLEIKYNFKTDTGTCTDLNQEELLELNTVA